MAIEWRALRWLQAPAFRDLAVRCGLPYEAGLLRRLAEQGLLPPATGGSLAAYCIGHLALYWLYAEAVRGWAHPWVPAGPPPTHREAALGTLRARTKAMARWLEGGPYPEAFWRELEAEMAARHPLGEARGLGRMLDIPVLESTHGEVRLFFELDRFFEALRTWAAGELGWSPGAASPAEPGAGAGSLRAWLDALPPELRTGLEGPPLQESEPGRPTLGRPPVASFDVGTSFTLSGADTPTPVAALFVGPPPATAQPVAGDETMSPGQVAREHARRAALETSALIPLSAIEERAGRQAQRLEAFHAREAELWQTEDWGALAAHYRASLDLFERDDQVGEVLEKLAFLYQDHLGRADEATDVFLRALERRPTSRPSLQALDRLLAERGRWEELAAIWQRTAIRSEGRSSSEAWTRVARILLEHLRNMPEAIRALRFALEADPSHGAARSSLAELASLSPEERSGAFSVEGLRREWSRLATIAERWASRLEDDSDAADWYEHAAGLHLSGEDGVSSAFACLEAALARDPQHIGAWRRIESLARHHHRWATFSEIVGRLVDRAQNQGNRLVLSLLADVLRERVQAVTDVEPIYARVLEALPGDSRAVPDGESEAETTVPPPDDSRTAESAEREAAPESAGGDDMSDGSATHETVPDEDATAPQPAVAPDDAETVELAVAPGVPRKQKRRKKRRH